MGIWAHKTATNQTPQLFVLLHLASFFFNSSANCGFADMQLTCRTCSCFYIHTYTAVVVCYFCGRLAKKKATRNKLKTARNEWIVKTSNDIRRGNNDDTPNCWPNSVEAKLEKCYFYEPKPKTACKIGAMNKLNELIYGTSDSAAFMAPAAA